MNIVHLPPDAIPLLDALLAGADTEDAMRIFRNLREAVTRWLDFHGAYTLNDEDARRMANVEVLWNEVDAALQAGSPREVLDRLLPCLYEAVGSMDAVAREREKPHFSMQRPINDFIMACAAYTLGRAEDRAITERLPLVDDYLVSVEALYRSVEQRIKPEVRVEIENGLTVTRLIVDDVRRSHNAGDVEGLRDALGGLATAASVLQRFLEWEQADQVRLAERHTRFSIPVVGPVLELGLDSARRAPRKAWAPAVVNCRREVVAKLVAFWKRVRPQVLLAKELREERLSTVDACIVGLDDALLAMLDETVETEAALERLETALIALSDAFTALERDAIRRDGSLTTDAETFLEAIGGLLDQTIPKLALVILLRTVRLPAVALAAGEALDRYLTDGNRAHLLDAAVILGRCKRETEQPLVPVLDTWPCPCCGIQNPLGTDACSGCHERTTTVFDANLSLQA